MNKRAIAAILVMLALGAQPALCQSGERAAAGAWDPAVTKSGNDKSKPAAAAVNGAHNSPVSKSDGPKKPAASGDAAAPASASSNEVTARAPVQSPATGGSIETGALPSAPVQQREMSGDWLIECMVQPAPASCTLRQVVTDSKKRRIIELRATSAGKTAFLEVLVPVGISIPYGVSVDVGETKKLRAQLVDCNQVGCRAVLPLGAETVAALKSAKTLGVTFQDSKSGKVISIGGSPTGFAAGITKVIGGS